MSSSTKRLLAATFLTATAAVSNLAFVITKLLTIHRASQYYGGAISVGCLFSGVQHKCLNPPA
jgi:hypothetical protein